MKVNPPDPWVLVGKIGKPVGLSGSVRVWSEANLEAIFEKQAPLGLWDSEGEPSARVRIEAVARDGKSWVVRIEGINNRESVTELVNFMLVVRREDLPDPGPGSAYWSDLVGAEVVTKEGEVLGKILDLEDTPSNTVLEIEAPNGGVFLIPLTEEVDADFEKDPSGLGVGCVSLHLPEGMREATTLERDSKPRLRKKRLRTRRGKRT